MGWDAVCWVGIVGVGRVAMFDGLEGLSDGEWWCCAALLCLISRKLWFDEIDNTACRCGRLEYICLQRLLRYGGRIYVGIAVAVFKSNDRVDCGGVDFEYKTSEREIISRESCLQ